MVPGGISQRLRRRFLGGELVGDDWREGVRWEGGKDTIFEKAELTRPPGNRVGLFRGLSVAR